MKEPVTLENYKDLKVEDLKAELAAREIAVEAGELKEDLQKKLAKALRKEAKEAAPKVEKAEPFDPESVTDEEVAKAEYNVGAPEGETDEQRRERVVAIKRSAHDKAFSELSDEEKEKAGIPVGTFGDIEEGAGRKNAEEGDVANRAAETDEHGEVAKSFPEDREEEVDPSDPANQDRSVNKAGETVATSPTTEEPKVVTPTDLPVVPSSIDNRDANQSHKAEDTVNPKAVANSEQPSVYDNNKVDVYRNGVFVKTFDGAVHGQNWKKLADEFVAAKGGELRQHRSDRDDNLAEVRANSDETMRLNNEMRKVDPEPRTVENPEAEEVEDDETVRPRE